ncbi:MAG: hypothetical protein ACYTG0_05340 [Planctomycetota bacterium]
MSTKTKGALLSLEHRIKKHEKKRIKRLLMGTARVLFSAAKVFLPGGWREKMVSGSKGIFQLATELDDRRPPADQIASFLYQVKKRFSKT